MNAAPTHDCQSSVTRFARAYHIATANVAVFGLASCLAGICAGTGLGGAITPGAIGALPLLPIVLRGGVRSRLTLAFCISVLFATVFLSLYAVLIVMVLQLKDRNELEGPRGEGSPLAPVLGLGLFALIFVLPWLIALIRGGAWWRGQRRG